MPDQAAPEVREATDVDGDLDDLESMTGLNLSAIRDLLAEVDGLRAEVERLKKRGPPMRLARF